ncbi:[Fe-Fe] hydrogenase large subunit C-terminal domain-containing protein [Clostridium hydrogenum]|uniref:[Fe-Fe] hydrogenase large subunit C-terminal domain-containing protein n=1 Tax=Clostridium hydrogenum TaxID=2855764 RepID=UPI001F3470F1|nr:[Fe-Fe] hydrogenase large subunit C-terminal domain-containing protein [Clostridium hydrogenum]
MIEKYNELFKSLVDSYYSNTFDSFVYHVLSDDSVNKEELAKVISSLCGTKVEFTNTDDFINSLKTTIKNYNHSSKIVEKINDCSMNCTDSTGKTSCQKSCPFDAILLDKEKQKTYIASELCTDCGKCIDACPSNSLMDKTEFLPIMELLKNNETVIAAVAPAISGQFGENVTLDKLRTAFKQVGFSDMIEVAFFADMLTLKEAVEFDEHVSSKDDFLITSCCCPIWVGMLKKVYGDLVKHVSPSVSPMIAAGRVIKKLNPDCKVVFIGPCIAKKAEIREKDLIGAIDFVLTFEETKQIFEALNINPSELSPDKSTSYASREGRLYARTGGVSTAVGEAVTKLFPSKGKLFKPIKVHGIKECKQLLGDTQNGILESNFLEGMGCIGGCVGGPKALVSKEDGTTAVNEVAENSEIKISLDNDCMKDILKRLGITSTDDFKDEEKVKILEREF